MYPGETPVLTNTVGRYVWVLRTYTKFKDVRKIGHTLAAYLRATVPNSSAEFLEKNSKAWIL